jgi:hypothetical protein
MEPWQRVVAVVDGRGGDSGDAELHVEPVDCPAIQLTDALLPVAQSTVGRDPYDAAGCVMGEHGARTYRFSAPEDGHDSFAAASDDDGFRPAITVERGPTCGGDRLQCNSGTDGNAEAFRYLAEGEHVTVVVAGHGGDGAFTLDAVRRGGDSCIDGTVDGPFSGVLPEDGAHRMTTSCGDASFTDGHGTRDLPDVNLSVPVFEPSPGFCGGCTVAITANFDFYASVSGLDDHGMCAAKEQQCSGAEQTDPGDFDNPPVHEASFGLPIDGQTRVLTLDRKLGSRSGPPTGNPPPEDTFEIEFWCAGVSC